jgi:hypothetical protein
MYWRTPELVTIADNAVSEQLASSVAETVSRVGKAEVAAILAACLPLERRTELARHYCTRILDTNETENNRATYASASRIAAQDLPADVRNELFDRLLPLDTATDSEHPFDVLQRRFSDRFGFIRIQGRSGELRRQVVKTLAVLAADRQRQDRVWRTAQQLAVSGEPIDANTVGYVGYTLAEHGYAPHMPWDAMACSPDSEIRRLAAALIPFTPDIDTELITNLARDKQTTVRSQLAHAIADITADTDNETTSHQVVDVARDILRSDPSYRVRSTLGQAAEAAS